MVVEISLYSDPILPKVVRITLNGEEKEFRIERRTVRAMKVEYYVSAEFPEELVRTIFGPEAVVKRAAWEKISYRPIAGLKEK